MPTTRDKLTRVTAVQKLLIKSINKGGHVFYHAYLPDVLALMSAGLLPQVKSTWPNGDGTHTLEVQS